MCAVALQVIRFAFLQITDILYINNRTERKVRMIRMRTEQGVKSGSAGCKCPAEINFSGTERTVFSLG